MFDFLKGGKVNFTFALEPAEFYRFGDTVQGKLTIENQNELKIQQGRIELVFKQESEYRHESTTTDSDGHRRVTITSSWQSDEQVAAQMIIMQDGTLPAKSAKTYEFSFAIPQNSTPSFDGGHIVRAKWFVKATLDRKMAADYNAQVDLPVYALALRQEPAMREHGNSNEPGEAEVVLRLPNSEWALGDTIEGELVIAPKKNFDASEIRVDLVRTEDVPRDEGNTYNEEQKIKLAGGTKLQAGQSLKFPFRITIPIGRPPTAQPSQFKVTWQLRGILARRFRGDTQGEADVYVYNARAD